MSAMIGIENFLLFLAAAVALNLTPGQDSLFIVGQSLARGRGAGVWSAFGISAGSLVHTLAAALGLSAILAASSLAFEVVKWAGVGYLVFLGLRMILERDATLAVSQPAESRSANLYDLAAFRRGVLTNVLNPKVAVFFLAFLPQFVSPDAPSPSLAFVLLGVTFVCTGTVWGLTLALLAARFSARARSTPGALRWVRRGSGALFIFLGLRLATSRAG